MKISKMPLFGKSSSSGKDDKKDDAAPKKSSSSRKIKSKSSERNSSSSKGDADEKKKKKKSSSSSSSSSKDKERKKSSSSDDKKKKKSSSSSSSSDKKKKSSSSSSSSDVKKKSSKQRSSSKSGSSSSNGTASTQKSATSSSSASASVNKQQGPGAVSVGSNTATFRVQVPPNIRPGEEFQVYAGSKIVKVRCPRNVRPGQSLQISVPVDPMDRATNNNSKGGKICNNGHQSPNYSSPQDLIPPNSDNVTLIPNQTLSPGQQPAYMVKIPEGVRGGAQFPVTISGQQLMVTCPPMACHPMSVRIVPPPPPPPSALGKNMDGRSSNSAMNGNSNSSTNGSNNQSNHHHHQQRHQQQLPRRIPNRLLNPNKQSSDKTQMFEVIVPTGVSPGQPFALLAGGVRVLVTCPKNAVPGKTIRFHLPIGLVNANKDGGPKSKLAEIKLSYDKDGWTRTIRATDMKFQWTRFDTEGNVDTRHRFDTERSAYVRKLDWEGDDDRMRKGRVSLVTPDYGVVDSKIKSANGTDLVTFQDIATAQNKSYEDKIQWFQDTCAQLCVEWNEGHMRMNVRRDYLLSDSMEAVMSLSRKDLRKVWRFEFIGEAGIDAGGLAREWFELVTEEVFDPDMGLWQTSASNQMCMQINPASGEFFEYSG